MFHQVSSRFIRYYRRCQHPLNVLNKEFFNILYLASGKNENVISHNETGWFEGNICENYRLDEITRLDFTRITSSAPRADLRIPRKHLALAFLFAALCAATGTLPVPRARHRVIFFTHSFALSHVKPQVADTSQQQACGYPCVGACVPLRQENAPGWSRIYKACYTRSGISLRYVASIAFRKWSA